MMLSPDAIKQSFDFAADGVRQLITLATGILAVMITFSKDIIGPVTSRTLRLLFGSWVLYLLSMVVGVLALGAMTGTLAQDDKPSVYATNILILTSAQWALFLLGTGILILYAAIALKGRATRTSAADAPRSNDSPAAETPPDSAAESEPQT